MNWFERWFLKAIIAKQVRQGYSHSANITELYSLIRDACLTEFYEDNVVTVDTYLQDRFKAAQPDKLAICLAQAYEVPTRK